MHSLQICHSEGRMKRRLVMAEDGSLLWWWWRGIWMCCWFDYWLCCDYVRDYVMRCVDLISKTIDGYKMIMTSIYYNGEWWTDTRRLLYRQNNTRNDTFSCLWWYDRNRVSCEWSFFLYSNIVYRPDHRFDTFYKTNRRSNIRLRYSSTFTTHWLIFQHKSSGNQNMLHDPYVSYFWAYNSFNKYVLEHILCVKNMLFLTFFTPSLFEEIFWIFLILRSKSSNIETCS